MRDQRLVVEQVRLESDRVVSLELVDPDGAALPPWQPGAHLDVVLPSGLVRQYSLCGPVEDRSRYRVAVLLEEASRGGSAEVHSSALVGRTLTVHGPRNNFPLVDATDYLFVAGGIGITPILSMVRAVGAAGRTWSLAYGGRTRRHMAFRAELPAPAGGGPHLFAEDEDGLIPVEKLVGGATAGTAVYCCGPEPLMRAVQQACRSRTPALDCHLERFTAGTGTPTSAPAGGSPFVVRLKRGGQEVTVAPDQTLLDALLTAKPDIPFNCREGFCGTCETTVVSGEPEHHDDLLSAAEQEAGDRMMICVGRSRSAVLVLDL